MGSTGDDAAVQVRAWLADPSPKRNLLLVDGPALSGKSRLLESVAQADECVVHVDASGMDAAELVGEMARQLGLPSTPPPFSHRPPTG